MNHAIEDLLEGSNSLESLDSFYLTQSHVSPIFYRTINGIVVWGKMKHHSWYNSTVKLSLTVLVPQYYPSIIVVVQYMACHVV